MDYSTSGRGARVGGKDIGRICGACPTKAAHVNIAARDGRSISTSTNPVYPYGGIGSRIVVTIRGSPSGFLDFGIGNVLGSTCIERWPKTKGAAVDGKAQKS